VAPGWWSGCEDPDFDADAVGDAGEVAGVAGDDGSLVAEGGGDDDGIHDGGGTRGGAGAAGGAAGLLVVREYVAAYEHAGVLVLGSAAPGAGQDDDDEGDGADPRAGELVVLGEEARGCGAAASSAPVSQTMARIRPAASSGSSSSRPASAPSTLPPAGRTGRDTAQPDRNAVDFAQA